MVYEPSESYIGRALPVHFHSALDSEQSASQSSQISGEKMRTIELDIPDCLTDDYLDSLLESLQTPPPQEPYMPTLHDLFDVEVFDTPQHAQAVEEVFPVDPEAFLIQLGLELAEAGIDPTIDLSCHETLEDLTTETGRYGHWITFSGGWSYWGLMFMLFYRKYRPPQSGGGAYRPLTRLK